MMEQTARTIKLTQIAVPPGCSGSGGPSAAPENSGSSNSNLGNGGDQGLEILQHTVAHSSVTKEESLLVSRALIAAMILLGPGGIEIKEAEEDGEYV